MQEKKNGSSALIKQIGAPMNMSYFKKIFNIEKITNQIQKRQNSNYKKDIIQRYKKKKWAANTGTCKSV